MPIFRMFKEYRQRMIKSKLESNIIRLEGDNTSQQIKAVIALGKLGNSVAVDPLMNVLKNKKYLFSEDDFRLMGYVAWALGELGATQAIKPIKKFIKVELGGTTIGADSLQEAAQKMAKIRATVRESQNMAREALEKLQKL